MDAEILLRLLAYALLLCLSGFFSGSETALFSLGPVQLMRLQEGGDPRLPMLRRLLEHPRRLIATIFIGNELVNVGASALMAGVVYRGLGQERPALATILSTSISVMLILLLGEITPKNVAARLVEQWSLVATRPIALLAVLMAPVRWVIEQIADAVVRWVGGGAQQPDPRVGEDEFRTMVDVANKKGQLDDREMELIHNVFEFGDRKVHQVMTPASDVFSVSSDISLEEVVRLVSQSRHSRVPVYLGSRQNVVGLLLAKDLVAAAHKIDAGSSKLDDFVYRPYYVPRTTKCERLLKEFRHRRMHLAMVVDEYGKWVGLVSMEDLLEVMFGEIRDEKDVPLESSQGVPIP